MFASPRGFMILMMACTAPLSAAQAADFLLPAGDRFRPGRCIPLLITNNTAGMALTCAGGVPITIEPGTDGVIPMLLLGHSATQLGTQILQPLLPNQKLVALTSADDAPLAQAAFPGCQIMPLRMNTLAGPTLAWEVLDAMICDRPPVPGKLAQLLAQGSDVIVRAVDRPDGVLNWQKLGDAWIVRHIGPDVTQLGQTAYLPTLVWRPGLSDQQRRQVVLGGVLVCLCCLASLLVPGRFKVPSLAGTLSVAAVSIAFWKSEISPLHAAGGVIQLQENGLMQVDHWTYLTTHTKAGAEQSARPVPADAEHADACGLELHVCSGGALDWHCMLPPDAKLAFVTREILRVGEQDQNQTTELHSPLADLARVAYASTGSRVQEFAGEADAWNTVRVTAAIHAAAGVSGR